MAWLGIAAVSWLLGGRIVRALGLPLDAESRTLGLLAGLAVCGLGAMLLGGYSLFLAQAVLYAGALALALPAARAIAGDHAPDAPLPRLARFEWACIAATALALACALVSALAPVTGWDAAVAHIALPAAYAREGRIALDPGNVYSGYPHLLHSLYALAFYPGYEKPVTLLSWSLALAACAAVHALGARVAGRAAGFVAMAILAAAPVFLDQAGTVSIDLAFAAFAAGALCALYAWRDSGRAAWLALAAGLAGASCGIRHTGLAVVPLLAAGVACAAPQARLRSVGMFVAIAAAASAPWLLRSWMVAGNPVFPLLTAWFPGARIDHLDISALGAHETVAAGGLGWRALLRFPWDIVMRPTQFDGWTKSPGGLVLALGVPGLLVGGPRVRPLGAFAIAGGIGFFFFQRFARYLLPFFVPMMVVAAAGALRLRALRPVAAAVVCAGVLHGLALHAAAVHFKVPVVLGLESRAEYLGARIERYGAFAWANERLNDGGRILTLDQRSYYLVGPSYQNHWALERIAGDRPEAQRAWLRAQGIRYILIPWDYLAGSPALRRVTAMLDAWSRDGANFLTLERLHLPRPGSGALERVEVLAVTGGREAG